MRFDKFQACGNDFLVIRESEPGWLTERGPAFFARLCDRHFGVGADGVEVLAAELPQLAAELPQLAAKLPGEEAAPTLDATIRLFNADGGETPISGNGTRCVGAYLYLVEGWRGPLMRIATKAGLRELRPVSQSKRAVLFETMMGRPGLSPEEIPVRLPQRVDRVIDQPLRVADWGEGETVRVTSVSMGNPHCTLFLAGEDPFVRVDWRGLGARLERHEAFPDRTNVEFVRVLDRQKIEARFWERGCGETLSSGTGACAAALAAMLTGQTDREVTVQTVAGELRVEWRADGTVWQTGEARHVFSGEWLPEELDGQED
jgi:diaminopimelate epimerase